jgi:hypothetical protein
VLKSLVKLAFVAAALVIGIKANDAQAAVSTPAAVRAAESSPAQATTVHWVCGEFRCVWRPNHRGPIHPWAAGWGPPRRGGCIWERVRGGPWLEVCR